MKYEGKLTIGLPRQRVIDLFDDPDNLPKWQSGLQSFEHLSGEAGQPDAKYQFVYIENGSRIEMVETITQRNFSDEFSATYETKGVNNWIGTFGDDSYLREQRVIERALEQPAYRFEAALGARHPAAEPNPAAYEFEFEPKVKLELKRAAEGGGCG